MALSSSAKSRPGGAATRRRVKSPEQVPEGMGAGAAGREDGAAGSHTTSSAEANAAGLPGGTAGLAQAENLKGSDARTSAMGLTQGDVEVHAQAGAAADWRAGVPSRLRRWLERARGLGLTEPEVVFDLHVRQGLPLLEVAWVLGLGMEAVRGLWLQSRAARAAQAPQSEMDFTSIREQIGVALWQTVVSTFPDAISMADAEKDAEADAPAGPTPPMLSVRLKALDQIAKLYDVVLETPASDHGPLPYATPEEIAVSVRERVLGLYGRG